MAPPPLYVPSFSSRRRLITGFHVIVSIVLLALLVGMVNYLGFRHFKRIHLNREVNHQLSERTKQILGSLDNDVEVIAFYNHEDSMFSRVDGLLKEYSLASKHIRYRSV
ncbi:MAG TPA: hypothetical protein EYG38_05995, partial [Verrucomicrobia bacterium]|nr:hypothetical protein [Verrucomicrobiota bacterium]